MSVKMLLIGGGGHCHSCIDVLTADSSFDIFGIIDAPEKKGQLVMGYPVIGSDDNLVSLISECDSALITVGFIKTPDVRKRLYKILSSIGYKMPSIIAGTAYKAKTSVLSEGTIVMHHAMVNARAIIGANCIINTKSLIEHDVVIGDNCHISTGAIVNGNCQVGNECLIGSGSIIKQGVTIVPGCIIGAGSVVIYNIGLPGVYVGNPARKIR